MSDELKTGEMKCALCGEPSIVDDIDVTYTRRVFPELPANQMQWLCHRCTAAIVRAGLAAMAPNLALRKAT